jgi:uncharacterized protein
VGRDYFLSCRTGKGCGIEPEGLVRMMKKNGVSSSVIFSCPSTKDLVCQNPDCNEPNNIPIMKSAEESSYTLECQKCGHSWKVPESPYVRQNDETIHASKKFNELVPFAIIDPRHPSQEHDLKKIIGNVMGVKIHPLAIGFNPFSLVNMSIMDMIEDGGLPVIFHSGKDVFSDPASIIKLAKIRSKTTFIIAHCAKLKKSSLIEAGKLSNVFVETSLATFWPKEANNAKRLFIEELSDEDKESIMTLDGVYRFLIGTIGPDKLLFGTDVPYVSPEDYSSHVDFFGSSIMKESDKEKILHENAERILY